MMKIKWSVRNTIPLTSDNVREGMKVVFLGMREVDYDYIGLSDIRFNRGEEFTILNIKGKYITVRNNYVNRVTLPIRAFNIKT